jgi:hypothetical protein
MNGAPGLVESLPRHQVHRIPDNGINLPVFVADANVPATQEEEVQKVLERISDAVTRLKGVDPLVQ